MKFFESLLPSKESKKRIKQSFSSVLFEKAFLEGVRVKNGDYSYLEDKCIEYLLKFNKKTRNFNPDLIRLWGILEMDKYLDFEFKKTINPYCGNVPIYQLDFYLPEAARIQTLLDIKHIKKVTINKVEFKNLYLATFEIKDNSEEGAFRPYVELYQQDENKIFRKIGYGYDTNNNKTVELVIDNFNYAVFLNSRGIVQIPFTGKKTKIIVDDILTDSHILKILSGFNMADIIIKPPKKEEK